MGQIKWIKLTTAMFDDEKIKLIETLPDADTILIIWIKLLSQAGKCNMNGFLLLSEKIPYTEDMLATIFNRPINTVKLALQTFEKFGMIQDINNAIHITNWEKHQNIEGMDKIREQTKKRVAEYRERAKKQNLLKQNNCNVTCNVAETQSNVLELELELDKELKNNNSLSEQNSDQENLHEEFPEEKPKKIFPENGPEINLSKYMFNFIKNNNPLAKKPNLQQWAKHFDLILRVDKREVPQIKKVIEWCQTDSFWMCNILSPAKLRKQYDQLLLKIKNNSTTTTKNKPSQATNYTQRTYSDEYFDNLYITPK